MAIVWVPRRVPLIIVSDFIVISKYYNRPYSEQQTSVSSKHAKIESRVSNFEINSNDSSELNRDVDTKDIKVEYHRGLSHFTILLPAFQEKCRFILNPHTNTIGDLINMLKREDGGIDEIVCKTADGSLTIASSTSIAVLLQEDFKLLLNNRVFNVISPKLAQQNKKEIYQLVDELKSSIEDLHERLQIKTYQRQKEENIETELRFLHQELQPLVEKKIELERSAERRCIHLSWVGLGLLSMQLGIVIRLIWWENSWDIMEPITYFVTYANILAAYAYFVVTKSAYILNDVKQRQYWLHFHKKAKELDFDVNKYNIIVKRIAQMERELQRLKNSAQKR